MKSAAYITDHSFWFMAHNKLVSSPVSAVFPEVPLSFVFLLCVRFVLRSLTCCPCSPVFDRFIISLTDPVPHSIFVWTPVDHAIQRLGGCGFWTVLTTLCSLPLLQLRLCSEAWLVHALQRRGPMAARPPVCFSIQSQPWLCLSGSENDSMRYPLLIKLCYSLHVLSESDFSIWLRA